jgi:hypothetical protein
MMSSPAYNGTLEFDEGVGKTALLAHLACCLRKVNAHEVRISPNSVSFRGGVFRGVSNWNILSPFGCGDLAVDDISHEVRYQLSFRQLILVVSTLLGLGAFSAWSDISHNPLMLVAFVVMWLWFVGGNLAIGIPRFERFLRDAIDTLPIENGVASGPREIGNPCQ